MKAKYYIRENIKNPENYIIYKVYDRNGLNDDSPDWGIPDQVYQVKKGWAPSQYMHNLFITGELDIEDDQITEAEAMRLIDELEKNANND